MDDDADTRNWRPLVGPTTQEKVQAGLGRARGRLDVLCPRTVNESELSRVLGEVIGVVGLLALPRVPSAVVLAALERARGELRSSGSMPASTFPPDPGLVGLRAAVEELVTVVEALVGVGS